MFLHQPLCAAAQLACVGHVFLPGRACELALAPLPLVVCPGVRGVPRACCFRLAGRCSSTRSVGGAWLFQKPAGLVIKLRERFTRQEGAWPPSAAYTHAPAFPGKPFFCLLELAFSGTLEKCSVEGNVLPQLPARLHLARSRVIFSCLFIYACLQRSLLEVVHFKREMEEGREGGCQRSPLAAPHFCCFLPPSGCFSTCKKVKAQGTHQRPPCSRLEADQVAGL